MREIMANTAEKLTWTTWEELLLACAVKRHGVKDWDSVAMELQSRSSLPLPLTAQSCRNKFHDLKRRFVENTDDDDEHDDTKTGGEVDSIPWLEELRKVRVAELKQEVHRYDRSIQSLQLKVKKLEEERELSLKETENKDEKTDLDKDLKADRSENGKNDGDGAPVAGKSVSSEDSDRQNRSFGESNSNRETGVKDEEREPDEPVETGSGKPDPVLSGSKPGGEDSYDDSSDTITKHASLKPSEAKKIGDSDELQGLAAESKEGMKESSDGQSSASLIRKRRRKMESSGGISGGDERPATTKRGSVKSEPLIDFLDIIRSHKHGSVFKRRLESQKTDKYKKMVRQHVDLKTVEAKLEDGSYSSCSSKFYRDLLLIFNNAIVFFPKASSESVAAYQLRDLVLKEMKKERNQRCEPSPELAPSNPLPLQPKPDPERPDSLLAKQKSSVPIIVCRKRSSVSAKASSVANKTEEPLVNEKPALNPKPPAKSSSNPSEEAIPMTKMKTKEKPVTGTRSLRKGNNRPNNNQITNSGSNNGSVDKREVSKSEKKRSEVTASAKKFLNRIKKNSPAKGTVTETLKSSGNDANDGGGRGQKRRRDGRKDVPLQRSGGGSGGGGGGGGDKKVKEESSPSKRSVGRPPKNGRDAVAGRRGKEGGEAEVVSKRPKKRSRR